MWGIVHQLQQLGSLVDDDGTIAPRKYGSKKPRDLYVLFFREPVRYNDRVSFNKFRPVVFFYFFIKECFQLIAHAAKLNSSVANALFGYGNCFLRLEVLNGSIQHFILSCGYTFHGWMNYYIRLYAYAYKLCSVVKEIAFSAYPTHAATRQ